jgi:hypothetical protein
MAEVTLTAPYASTSARRDHHLWWQTKDVMKRLMFSTHTKDIALVTIASLALLIILLVIWIGIWVTEDHTKRTLSEIASVVGVLAGACIAIIAWAYRTASQRLGVVDSIASNIFAILRISASLFVVQSVIWQYRKEERGTDVFFISHEEYNITESINPNDIGFLRQDTIKRIHGFYITLRAYRDRALTLEKWYDKHAKMRDIKDDKIPEFQSITCSLIYYAFLCIENGRIALFDLLENQEFRDESVFIAITQDLRAYTFLLEEASENALPPYLRHRLRERIPQKKDGKEQNDEIRERDPKENCLLPGYVGGFARLKKYIRDLRDPRYPEDLEHLLGSDNMTRLFGKNYFHELRGQYSKPDA